MKWPYAMQYMEPVQKTDEEWKGVLSPEEYRVLRESGTEAAFAGD